MTNQEAIKILDNLKPGDYSDPYEKGEAIVMAISALQAQEAKAQLSAEGTTSDLISRQDAIEHLKKRLYETALNNCTEHPYYEEIADNRVDTWLNEVPSAQPEPQWIPCSKRLPEVGKDVMVCYDFKGHRSVLIGVLYGDGKFHGYDDEYLTPEGRKYRKAVAWKPLPEPYREEDDDER